MNETTPVHDSNGGSVPLRTYIERILEERDKAVVTAQKSMEMRLEALNNLRAEVQADRGQFLRLDVYDEKHEALEHNVLELERTLTRALSEQSKNIHRRIDALESWRLKAVGAALILVPLAGLIGAAIMRAFS